MNELADVALCIGGDWAEGELDPVELRSPATGELIGRVAQGTRNMSARRSWPPRRLNTAWLR